MAHPPEPTWSHAVYCFMTLVMTTLSRWSDVDRSVLGHIQIQEATETSSSRIPGSWFKRSRQRHDG